MTQNPSVPPTSPPPPPPGPPAPPESVAGEPAAPRRPGPLRRVPRAAWLSAAAVVVVLGVGLGGFLLGRATAPEHHRPPFDRGQWPDSPGDRGPGGRGRPGQWGQPPAQPDDGTTDGSTQGSSADTTAWYVVPLAA